MAVTQFLFIGDSLTAGTAGSFNVGQGGKGSWVELLTEAFAHLLNLPILGPGIRGLWNDAGFDFPGSGEWTHTGSWTKTGAGGAFDCAPYGYSWTGNSIGDTVTWTRSAKLRPVVGFSLYWIDRTSAANDNWQYQIDGGSWVNMGQSIAADNKLAKFYVASSVTSTVAIRCYDGTADAHACLVGIEPYYLDPRSNSGVIVQNLTVNGEKLRTLWSSGLRLSFVDRMKLGTGSPPSSTPNAGTLIMHINDFQTALSNPSQWASDLTQTYNYVAPFGPVAFMNPWESGPYFLSIFDTTSQANGRAQTKTTAASLSVPVLDHFDVETARGITNNAAMNANGLLVDTLHESQLYHQVLWQRIFWFMRQNFLHSIGGQPRYPVIAGSTTLASLATSTPQAVSAGLPIQLAA